LTFADGSKLNVSGIAGEVQETIERILPVMRPVSPSEPKGPVKQTVWISGSFYLLVVVVAVVAALAIVQLAPGWLVVPTAAIAIVVFLVVAAVVLRHNEKLSEKGFLTVIEEAIKHVRGLDQLTKK
jgi:F0F1-type ATP synthase membrane subunit a